ncbi:alpha/beta hydrolase [Amycolatopsis rhabdoformis]|uniref:Alpha/beta hydrolase n=1 Tax=Amycolatopsis rhabdoformis TaxID=1448059 RepID=A0ABZ1ILU4_9PSEU|nr:alpha/beta hydrolase [Amycolatopsis rhabdoformis]WSE34731.1 alpha/beta hydrolase [Amycolatopsis rhabdoformis]
MTAPTGERLGGHRHPAPAPIPENVTISLHTAETLDGAKVNGVLYHPPGATTCVTVLHPRLDMSRHPIIGLLLRAGLAVWSHGMRAVGTDHSLVHEQALLDVAAGYRIVRDRYERLVPLGHSGGGTLNAFYLWQASAAPQDRIATTPAGRPTRLAEADLPLPDAVVFLAAHPGQGEVLLHSIDPSVVDEQDPLARNPELDLFDPANGFAEPPSSAKYSAEFLQRYRAAQRARLDRLDAVAREWVEAKNRARARYRETRSPDDRRATIAPRFLIVNRTEADPRYVDLSIDPNDRPYGSLHGSLPHLINYGTVGFGRICTPDAWLSTWSGLSTNASFAKAAPHVTLPTLYLEFSGDQTLLPQDAQRLYDLLGGVVKERAVLPGLHFGAALTQGGRPGIEPAAEAITEWLEG